jgi:hypothetical protein
MKKALPSNFSEGLRFLHEWKIKDADEKCRAFLRDNKRNFDSSSNNARYFSCTSDFLKTKKPFRLEIRKGFFVSF